MHLNLQDNESHQYFAQVIKLPARRQLQKLFVLLLDHPHEDWLKIIPAHSQILDQSRQGLGGLLGGALGQENLLVGVFPK